MFEHGSRNIHNKHDIGRGELFVILRRKYWCEQRLPFRCSLKKTGQGVQPLILEFMLQNLLQINPSMIQVHSYLYLSSKFGSSSIYGIYLSMIVMLKITYNRPFHCVTVIENLLRYIVVMWTHGVINGLVHTNHAQQFASQRPTTTISVQLLSRNPFKVLLMVIPTCRNRISKENTEDRGGRILGLL